MVRKGGNLNRLSWQRQILELLFGFLVIIVLIGLEADWRGWLAAATLLFCLLAPTPIQFIAVALVAALLYGGCELSIHLHRLSFVPQAMGVRRVLYISGEGRVGIIVYQMPDAVASELSSKGLEYLENLPSTASAWNGHGRYSDWRLTPMEMKGAWGTDGSPIGNYLGRYGDFIRVAPGVADLVNNALLMSGSYYALGRRTIVLIPSAKRVVVAY